MLHEQIDRGYRLYHWGKDRLKNYKMYILFGPILSLRLLPCSSIAIPSLSSLVPALLCCHVAWRTSSRLLRIWRVGRA